MKLTKVVMIGAMITAIAGASVNNSTLLEDKCSGCKDVIRILDEGATSPVTKELVETLLDKVCEEVPGYLVGVCKSAVGAVTPEIIDLIVKYGITDKICVWIRMCS